MARHPFPHLPRWLSLTLVASACFLLVWVPFLALALGLKSDFLAFYTGGTALLRGVAAQLYDFDLHQAWQLEWVGPSKRVSHFVYLPLFATFYLPLAAPPLWVARLLWLLGSLACLALAALMAQPWSGLTRRESALVILAFPGTYGALLVGQNSPLTLLLFASVARLLWRGERLGLAGVIAALALYKPQLLIGLLLWGLWQRRWQSMAGFVTVAFLIGVGSLLVSVPATLSYVSLGQELFGPVTAHGVNAALYAELRGWFSDPLAGTVGIGLGGGVMVALLLAWRHPTTPYHHAMLWLLPFLLSPYLANYDLMLLLLPLAFLAPCLPGDRVMQGIVAVLWLGPLVNLLAGDVALLAAWASLALYGLCFWRATTQRTPWVAAAPASP